MLVRTLFYLFCSSMMATQNTDPDYPPPEDYYFAKNDEVASRPKESLLPDLETMKQDFVLETKQIHIPGYPEAFNPSIVKWQGKILMSFRTYDEKTRIANEVGLVHLNDQFEPIDTPSFLQFRFSDLSCRLKRQDPRIIVIGDKLFIVYNNALDYSSPLNKEVRRMHIAEIQWDGESYYAKDCECLLNFDGEQKIRIEKNWVPFDYFGKLHFVYSMLPHRIFRPIGANACETVAFSMGLFEWEWGILRGGTPALLEEKEYLSFFHSSKIMATIHSHGNSMVHYFMGAYTFSAKPPFEMKKISPEPIIGKNFYNGPEYKTWKPLRVIFPGGYLSNQKFIWVFYGRQDHEIWVVKLDKKKFMGSLVPVPTVHDR